MKLSEATKEKFFKELEKAKSYEDLMGKEGAIKNLIKSSLENMLETELSEHLGYEKHSIEGINTGNSRNGKSYKSLTTDEGKIELTIPRDRNSTFDPIVVKVRKDIGSNRR